MKSKTSVYLELQLSPISACVCVRVRVLFGRPSAVPIIWITQMVGSNGRRVSTGSGFSKHCHMANGGCKQTWRMYTN